MINRLVIAACAGILLGACAHAPAIEQVHLPDGSVGNGIRCGTTTACMNKAAEICTGPYEVVSERTGGTRGSPGSPGWTATEQVYNYSTKKYDTVAVQRGAYAGSAGASYVEMVFACRSPTSVSKSDARPQADVQQEVLKFSRDPRYPHYQRLKLQMAELLDTNRANTLEDAYSRACALDKQCSADAGIK
jgi:hypothetical protein